MSTRLALPFALAMTATVALAQEMQPVHSITPAQAAVCVPVDGPIEVDGALDEPAWGEAIPFSGFTSSTQGGMVANTTRVMVVRDADALYFGVRCRESHMDKLVATKTSRDSSIWADDCIEIFLDLEHQHRVFTQLAINSVPTVFDARASAGTWDGEWQVASSTDDEGWTVELRMAWTSLEVEPPAEGAIWGLNVCRERQTEQRKELHNWADVGGVFNRTWLFGHLYFAGRSFELTDAVAKAMYEQIQVPTNVYLPGGYALIGPQAVAGRHDYREVLRGAVEQAPGLTDHHRELREAYRAHADLPFRDEFDDLDGRYRDLHGAMRSHEPLDPADWSRQTAVLVGLGDEMVNLGWRVKVALLLKEA